MNISDLWQQIIANPGDENRKVQYIEALAQAGDPRAEMFRLATELQNLTYGYFERQAELTRQYESILAHWRVDFEAPARAWQAELQFVRGWPTEITIKARNFTTHAAVMVATVPLRHLNLTAVSEAPEVFQVAQLGQIASLDGGNQHWTNEAITALAASPQLHSLRWLNLSGTGLTDADVEILAASPHLRHLAHVDVGENPCRDPVDASEGCGVDGFSGLIVAESIWLPEFGRELEARYGTIDWLHALLHFMERHPPSRYLF